MQKSPRLTESKVTRSQHSERVSRNARVEVESDGRKWRLPASLQSPAVAVSSGEEISDPKTRKRVRTTERADLLVLPVADTQGCRTDWLKTVEM